MALQGTLPGSRAPFEFRVCEECGAGFVHPWPEEDQVAALYTGEYAYYNADRDDPESEARSLKFTVAPWRHGYLVPESGLGRAHALAGRLIEVAARKTITYSLGIPLSHGHQVPMLDFGCGSGLWLRAMRRKGFEQLAGHDLSVNDAIRRRLAGEGIDYLEDLEDPLAAGRFGVVRLEQVFEHLWDPRGTLDAARRLLRPGGWLVMTFPSIYPWRRFENLAECPGVGYMQLPMHLVHHSRESARLLVEAAGFILVGCRVTHREKFITLAARAR